MKPRILIACALIALGLLAFATAKADDAPAPHDGNANVRFTYRVLSHSIETVEPDAWKPIADKQQEQNVAALKAFADKAMTDNKVSLRLLETPHFLIYSDLISADASDDAVLLESGYGVVGKILNLTRSSGLHPKTQGTNLFRGKMLYFIFRESRNKDALDFALKLHPMQLDASISEEMDHGPWASLTMNGNGSCDVVASADNNMNSQFPLIRTMALASLFRFHSPKPLPLWVQDGLVFGVAGSLAYTPQSSTDSNRVQDRQRQLDRNSKNILRQFGHGVDYYLDSNPHQDQCSMLYDNVVTFMYHQSGPRFDAFILGMKDGLDWEKSLETKYGITRDRLVSVFTAVLNRSPS